MLKNRILLLSFVVLCFVAACKSDPAYNPAQQLTIDVDSIAKYIVKNSITDSDGTPVKKTAQGLYYCTLYNGGTDTRVINLDDSVLVHYVGRIMATQQVFDSTATNDAAFATKFLMRDVIQGWQMGIPKVKEGGHIRLLVPSPLAYQNRQISSNILLKPNSILDFDIRVIKVIDPTQFRIIK